MASASTLNYEITLDATNTGSQDIGKMLFQFNILTSDRKKILGNTNDIAPDNIHSGQSFSASAEYPIDYNIAGGARASTIKMSSLLRSKSPALVDVSLSDSELKLGGPTTAACQFVKIND